MGEFSFRSTTIARKLRRLPEFPAAEAVLIPESHEFVFRPKNRAQREVVELWKRCRVMFLAGCAGAGKSHVALSLAISEALKGNCRKIMLARPLVENGRSLGYLPGEAEAKLMPWLAPFQDVAECCVGGKNSWESLLRLLDKNGCELEPCAVEMLQGRNVRGILIVDECQNLTWSQLKCVLTRVCEGGRVILTGDPDQRNLDGEAPMVEVMARLSDLDTVGVYQFRTSDIVRDPIVGQILDRLQD